MSNIRAPARKIIVYTEHLMTDVNKPITKMAAKKASPSGHEDAA